MPVQQRLSSWTWASYVGRVLLWRVSSGIAHSFVFGPCNAKLLETTPFGSYECPDDLTTQIQSEIPLAKILWPDDCPWINRRYLQPSLSQGELGFWAPRILFPDILSGGLLDQSSTDTAQEGRFRLCIGTRRVGTLILDSPPAVEPDELICLTSSDLRDVRGLAVSTNGDVSVRLGTFTMRFTRANLEALSRPVEDICRWRYVLLR